LYSRVTLTPTDARLPTQPNPGTNSAAAPCVRIRRVNVAFVPSSASRLASVGSALKATKDHPGRSRMSTLTRAGVDGGGGVDGGVDGGGTRRFAQYIHSTYGPTMSITCVARPYG